MTSTVACHEQLHRTKCMGYSVLHTALILLNISGFGCLVVLLANVVTTITTLSMSAVATNGRIKAGMSDFTLLQILDLCKHF